ncbi:MAG TPA: 16S rRNA (cytidine(1402)-2'-O)-methyltransferase [Candidatus Margulisiibacteriota bacterium]|nr:16S rRNA (cytidine(1402)-2'-O)-methyltransferase [Candidatus Margulisiibacteriota bacterium]
MGTPGTLFVVATPLGNLEDITLRALRVLKEVGMIAAEDTRHSRKLLAHYGITTPLTSYYDENERHKAPALVEQVKHGKSLALISDAGTPGIADPGYHLVRAAIAAGVRVVPIPGPSAVAAALSVAGLPTDRFAFDGFVPAKVGARRKFFTALAQETRTLVVYEAARRLEGCLQDLHEILGNRQVVMLRELTKLFEEIVRGPVSEVAVQLRERAATRPLQGEVTLVIAAGAPPAPVPAEDLTTAIQRLRGEGMSLKEIARVLARERSLSRRQVYQAGLALPAEHKA